MTQAENPEVLWAIRDIKARAVLIGRYRDYYDGNHHMPWATPKWNLAFSDLFASFRDNLCPAIVDAKADRIQLTNIDGGSNAVNAAIARVWDREKLEVRQGEVTKNALKDGDAFVIVWPDAQGQARWYIQRGDRMAARYADEPQGELEIAAKLWPVDEWTVDGKSLWRLNLYYRDRIERYVTLKEVEGNNIPEKLDAWAQYEPDLEDVYEEGEDESPPVLGWSIPNDYGIVPVFPFPNNADTGAYGMSELKDIIPIQNALNKSVCNMLVAGEFAAAPQRYLIGLEVDTDEEGNPTGKEQKQAFDRILAIGNPNAKAGQFDAADLGNFIKEQDSYRAEMARVSRTPLHYLLLDGDFPSGEALDAAMEPLIAQVDDRILSMKPVWQAAMSFSLLIEHADHDPAALNPTFKPTQRKNPTTFADEMRLKKELGVPDEVLWQEMGYDEEQVKEFAAQKLERAAQMQAAFDAGAGDTVNPAGVVGTPAANLVE